MGPVLRLVPPQESGKNSAMKVLVVDDHAVVRQGLAVLLTGGAGEEVTVLEAGNAEEALRIVQEHDDLDIALLDLMLPDSGGLALLHEIRKVRSHVPAIVISASEDPRDAQRALQSGALGYMPKSASPTTLISAIRMVLGGDLYLPPLLLQPASRGHQDVALTQRQQETLAYLAKGYPNKIIAEEMGLSEKTVKAHLTALFRELNVSNRAQAIETARALGIV